MSADHVFMHLRAGGRYRVIAAFRDFDGALHPVGECWRFLSHSFLPYDDGLSLFVETDGGRRQIRLRWTADDQAGIIDNLSAFVVPES